MTADSMNERQSYAQVEKAENELEAAEESAGND